MKCETVAEAFFLRGTLTQRYNTKTDTNTKIQDKHKHIDTTQTHRYNTKTKTNTKIQDILSIRGDFKNAFSMVPSKKEMVTLIIGQANPKPKIHMKTIKITISSKL